MQYRKLTADIGHLGSYHAGAFFFVFLQKISQYSRSGNMSFMPCRMKSRINLLEGETQRPQVFAGLLLFVVKS